MSPFVVKFPCNNLSKYLVINISNMMKLGNIRIKHPLFLAPMAGVTDKPCRIIYKRMGASVVYTEFVSADGIIRENTKTLNMIEFTEEERPIGVQIFGDDPEVISKSAAFIYAKYKPDIIDINFGCPVPKVTKRGAGSAALKDLVLMHEISSSVVEAVSSIPVTAKMRSGWDNDSIVVEEAGNVLEKSGIAAITLHARTTKQGYAGKSNWNLIKKLKESVDIPVIGNGDVDSIESYKQIKDHTKCDGVMIGRGALGNPWIFKQILNSIKNNPIESPSLIDIVSTCKDHIDLLSKHKSSIASVNLSKKHINFYLKNFHNSSTYRKKLMLCDNTSDMLKILDDIVIN